MIRLVQIIKTCLLLYHFVVQLLLISHFIYAYKCLHFAFYTLHFTDVDRLPLVSSAIIQVAQDVDEPWPVEVIGHDGKAYNITMEPGDMVLYESHTILHGRPYPLSGQFYVRTRT